MVLTMVWLGIYNWWSPCSREWSSKYMRFQMLQMIKIEFLRGWNQSHTCWICTYALFLVASLCAVHSPLICLSASNCHATSKTFGKSLGLLLLYVSFTIYTLKDDWKRRNNWQTYTLNNPTTSKTVALVNGPTIQPFLLTRCYGAIYRWRKCPLLPCHCACGLVQWMCDLDVAKGSGKRWSVWWNGAGWCDESCTCWWL